MGGLLKDLETVDQTSQLTDNQLMTNTLVLMLPYKHREKLIELKGENENLPAERQKSVWDLVWEYIKSAKSCNERNSPWLHGSIASDVIDQYEGEDTAEKRKLCSKPYDTFFYIFKLRGNDGKVKKDCFYGSGGYHKHSFTC